MVKRNDMEVNQMLLNGLQAKFCSLVQSVMERGWQPSPGQAKYGTSTD